MAPVFSLISYYKQSGDSFCNTQQFCLNLCLIKLLLDIFSIKQTLNKAVVLAICNSLWLFVVSDPSEFTAGSGCPTSLVYDWPRWLQSAADYGQNWSVYMLSRHFVSERDNSYNWQHREHTGSKELYSGKLLLYVSWCVGS